MKSIRTIITKNDLLIISIIAFCIFYLLAIIKPHHIFWSLDEGGKWIYLESVIREGNPRSPLIYPGEPLDSDLENVALFFYSHQGNQIYSWWQVGFPLLTLPFYKLLGWFGLYFLPALAGSFTAFLSGRITKVLTENSSLLSNIVALVVAFCSPILFYSTTFWEHTISVAFVIATAFLLLISKNSTSNKTLLAAGITGSLSVFFRTEAILIIAGFWIAFVFIDWKKTIPFSISGEITTSIWAIINFWLMGNPLSPNTQVVQQLSSFNGLINNGVKYIPYMLFNAPIISAYSLGKGLLIFGTIMLVLAIIFGLFKKTRILSIIFFLATTSVCIYVLLQPSMYRSVHGFILICPLIASFSLVYKTNIWRKYKSFFLISLAGVTTFFIGFMLRAWLAAGGLQWGPRYMLALYPLLIIPTVIGFSELIKSTKNWIKHFIIISIIVSFLTGLGYQIRGYITMVKTMELYNQSANYLRKMDDEIIVTNCTWMPMVIPDLYWNGNIFTKPPKPNLLENLKFKRNKFIY